MGATIRTDTRRRAARAALVVAVASLCFSSESRADATPTELAAPGELLAMRPPPPPGRRPAAAPAASTQPSTDAAGATTTASGVAAAPATAPAAVAASQPSDTSGLFIREDMLPTGAAGPSPMGRNAAVSPLHARSNANSPQEGFIPIPDRYRIGVPGNYTQNTRSSNLFNPYKQNVLKGDYPILDDDKFLILTFTSDTLVEARRLPTPSGVAASDQGSLDFFGSGHQQLINQNFITSIEFFQGETVYKPRDIEFKATVVANYNYVNVDESNIISPTPTEGSDRHDDKVAIQELFVDKHLADLSPNYDFVSLRAGVQGFNSDFRGFLFADNTLGVRLLGNYDNGQTIYNIAYFRQIEKDTNSGLNTYGVRDQDIFLANIYREDFIWHGYTAQLSAHMNYDHSGMEFDQNGFLVRPAPIGTIDEKEVRTYYLGWAGDGHIGRFNITHQYYYVFGTETFNPIADKEVSVDAHFFATELSYDVDYVRFRGSFVYASGDPDPTDDRGTGFDAIFENPNIAGGGFSYFTRQAVALTGGGTGLKGRNALNNSLRTSKEQGQANHVNPGLYLYNIGMDIDVTPKLKVFTNASYLQFAETETLKLVQFDDKIGKEIGYDLSIGFQYRPLNNQNIVFTAGAAALIPGDGFQDLYTNETLYSTFFAATLTY